MEGRLVFLIGAPRTGSTLLARMLGAHSAIAAPPEPQLIPPLAHLGFYDKVDDAPYDPIITQIGIREFVAELPRGEADYLDALRACTDTLYERALEASGRKIFVDKTPSYALVLDFLVRLYPRARYLVLTRHPLAIWSSVVESFFDGDPEAAERGSPGLPRYVPAIARFLRERPVPLHHLRYEELVSDPAAHLERICGFLELPFEPGMVEYGRDESAKKPVARGLGDPVTVGREQRPTTASVKRWAAEMAGSPARLEQARRIVARLPDEDLETWGHPRSELEAELDAATPSGVAAPRRKLTRYALERRLLVLARRNVQRRGFLARLVRQVRMACDVLLR